MPAYLKEANKNYNQIRRVRPDNPIEKLEYYQASKTKSLGRDSGPIARRRSQPPPPPAPPMPNESSSAGSSSGRSLSSPTSYTSKLVNLIRSRKPSDLPSIRATDRVSPQLITSGSEIEYLEHATNYLRPDVMKSSRVQTTCEDNLSPFQSSGFSEGTMLGPNLEFYQGPNGDAVPLGRRYIDAVGDRYRRQSSSSGTTKSAGLSRKSFREGVLTSPSYRDQKQQPDGNGRQNQKQVRLLPPSGGRTARRKITRINRRMLTGRNRDDNDNSFEGYSYSPYALSELFSQSEIPGFREIFASDSYLRKFCWIVAFLFMTVLSLNDMTELITEYYEYPITVDVRLKDTAKLPFPAVTVCNLNAVRFSALCSNSRFELSSQMPSEMRDKLCGIQVEKKKQNNSHTPSDSDISDINNIGITTTTTTAATTTTITTTTTTSGPTSTMDSSSGGVTMHQAAVTVAPVATTVVSGGGFRPTQANPTQTTHSPPRRWPWAPQRGPVGLLHQPEARRDRAKRSHDGERPFAPKKWVLKVRPAKPIDDGPIAPHLRNKNKASQFNSLRQTNNVSPNQPNAQLPAVSVRPASGSGGAVSGGQLPNSRLPPNQQQQPSLFWPQSSPDNLGVSPNQQQQLGTPTSGKNNNINNNQQQPNSMTNFMPLNPIEDFELTERQERELQENLTNWLAVMYQRDPQMTRSLGHQFDDMILRCTMKSINCTRQRSFENSFSPTEGNCFTYRSRVKRKLSSNQMTMYWDTFEESNLAGTNDGLELVLNLEKNEYISGSSQVGALVMIHHPSDLGYAASEATFIAPEFTTYIGLKMVNISRLPAPYPESCVDSWPAKFADTLTKNSTYSQQACLKICLQKTIQTHCNCQSAFLPIVELSSNQQQQQQQQQSDATSTTTASSITEHSPDSGFSTTTTESPDIISSFSMNLTTPSSSFVFGAARDRMSERNPRVRGRGRPSGSMLKAAAALNSNGSILVSANADDNNQDHHQQPQQPKQPQQRIIICDTRKRATRQCVREVNLRAADRVHNCECPAKCGVIRYDKTISMARWPTREDKVSFDRGKLDVNFQNLAKVIVYFQTMTCEEVQQQPVFNAAKLFSSLGGIMGMYVGFSFLSVFEIFEVMSRKFWHYLTLRYNGRRFG